jgi:low temperature requirement protein LtrA
VLVALPTWKGLIQLLVMISLIWWMYDGYAWLTNAVSASRGPRQAVLLTGMGAFLLLSLSVPGAFHGGGGEFGLAYLIIVALHLWLFSRASSSTVVHAIFRIAPSNAAAALLVVAGGFAGGIAQYVMWGSAILVAWGAPFFVDDSGFEVEPIHFVERHRVLVLVAIGESLVAAGYGASRHPLTLALTACYISLFVISGGLWWAYFGRDDGSVDRAVAQTPARQRPHRVLVAFGIWHLILLAGVVIEASGLRRAVEAPLAPLATGPAIALAAGVSLYLAGETLFRKSLGLALRWPRLAAAVLVAGAIPLGATISATAETAVVAGSLIAAFTAEAIIDKGTTPLASGAAEAPRWSACPRDLPGVAYGVEWWRVRPPRRDHESGRSRPRWRHPCTYRGAPCQDLPVSRSRPGDQHESAGRLRALVDL